jgi:hypothetical protein
MSLRAAAARLFEHVNPIKYHITFIYINYKHPLSAIHRNELISIQKVGVSNLTVN